MKVKIKKWDILILIGSVILSFVPMALRFSINSNVAGNEAIISVSGNKVKSLEMNKNGIFEFEFNGKKGYVEVFDNKIRMLEMDKITCPERICSDRGWIENSSENIVCLPNRIIVTLGNSNSDVDISTN
ncbi:MAG: NusG domain II-containing protein [Clostridiaceae bacterium]